MESTLLFNIPFVCPEPVLANDRVLNMINLKMEPKTAAFSAPKNQHVAEKAPPISDGVFHSPPRISGCGVIDVPLPTLNSRIPLSYPAMSAIVWPASCVQPKPHWAPLCELVQLMLLAFQHVGDPIGYSIFDCMNSANAGHRAVQFSYSVAPGSL